MGVKIGDFFGPAASFPDVGVVLNILIRNIWVAGGVVFLGMFVYAGIQFLRKAGKLEPAEYAKVQNIMTAAVVGLIIMFVAYWLVIIIEMLSGVKIFNSEL